MMYEAELEMDQFTKKNYRSITYILNAINLIYKNNNIQYCFFIYVCVWILHTYYKWYCTIRNKTPANY